MKKVYRISQLKNFVLAGSLSVLLLSQIYKSEITKILHEVHKQIGQWVVSHVPYIQLIEIYKGYGLFSKTPIPSGSLGYYGRGLQVIPQTLQIYGLVNISGEIIQILNYDIQKTITTLLQVIESQKQDLSILGIGIVLGQFIYYGMILPGDVRQTQKQIFHK